MPSIIKGSQKNDKSLKGSKKDDTIAGLGGDDTIRAYEGNDLVYGGKGNDTIYGGRGDDILYGDAGDDILSPGDGNNKVIAGAGNDLILVDANSRSWNNIDGGDGNNTLDYSSTQSINNAGVNMAFNLTPNQVSFDYHWVNGIAAGVFKGAVYKIAAATALEALGTRTPMGLYNSAAPRDDISNVKNIIGTKGSDLILGNGLDNVLDGGGGSGFDGKGLESDVIAGFGGNDTLKAGNASGWYYGDEGNDTFIAGEYLRNDRVFDGGDGTDTADYSAFSKDVSVTLADKGDAGKAQYRATQELIDTLYNVENIVGGTGNDALYGTANSNNQLDGGAGNDLLSGGGGNDRLNGGAGNDIYVRNKGDGGITTIVDTSGQDTLRLSDINFNQVKILAVGDDLQLNLLSGKKGSVTIKDRAVETYVFADRTLTSVAQLLQAAASFAPVSAAAGQTTASLATSATQPQLSLNNTH